MILPRNHGEWAVPNLFFYYWACFLQQMGIVLVGEGEAKARKAVSPNIFQMLLGSRTERNFFQNLESSYYKKTCF